MADITPASRARQQSLKILLEQTEGWGYVLEFVFRLLQHYEGASIHIGNTTEARLDALARKAMLLEFVQKLYQDAEVESPFVKHYAALVAGFPPAALAVLSPPASPTDSPTTPDAQEAILALLAQRRPAGSVV